MSHTITKIWMHSMWSSNGQEPIILPFFQQKLFRYIADQLSELGCPARTVNGTNDHVHALYLLNPQLANSDVIKQIKGSSSHFINQNNFLDTKFSWQKGYAAFSVSESMINKVSIYIKNQSSIHKNKSYQNEYNEFLKLNGYQ